MEARSLMMSDPITEQANELSLNIDISSPYEIVSILHKCDLEIFEGWRQQVSLTDAGTIAKMMKIASHIQRVIQDPSSGTVIMSGCGTSGRLAFLTARKFNEYLRSEGKEECFQYIMAGQDKALFTSQELAEDDPIFGAKCLEEAARDKTRVVYIGISCGLSAPFVAGQLDFCLSNLKRFTPVVLGFNPAHLARDVPIHNWDKTFFTVVNQLQEAETSDQGFILNPVVGPEAITGSSRMKSGSATLILLECLAMTAIEGFREAQLRQLLDAYHETCGCVYQMKDTLGKLINVGADSLSSNSHIFYLGRGEFGLTAMVDASECPPTFSATPDEVRGFVSGGYGTLENNDGDLSHLGQHYQISLRDFENAILPNLQDNDLLVVINQDVYEEVKHFLRATTCKKVFIGTEQSTLPPAVSNQFEVIVNIPLRVPSLNWLAEVGAREVMRSSCQKMALKWVLNALSTGSFVLKGKVFRNRMVDVKVSNTKLYYRAVGIVQKFAACSLDNAEESLLKSIYGSDQLTDETKDKPVLEHVTVGAVRDQVVPMAILVASLGCTVEDARGRIQGEPVIRKLLSKLS